LIDEVVFNNALSALKGGGLDLLRHTGSTGVALSEADARWLALLSSELCEDNDGAVNEDCIVDAPGNDDGGWAVKVVDPSFDERTFAPFRWFRISSSRCRRC